MKNPTFIRIEKKGAGCSLSFLNDDKILLYRKYQLGSMKSFSFEIHRRKRDRPTFSFEIH